MIKVPAGAGNPPCDLNKLQVQVSNLQTQNETMAGIDASEPGSWKIGTYGAIGGIGSAVITGLVAFGLGSMYDNHAHMGSFLSGLGHVCSVDGAGPPAFLLGICGLMLGAYIGHRQTHPSPDELGKPNPQIGVNDAKIAALNRQIKSCQASL
jgi:hypothetical protein